MDDCSPLTQVENVPHIAIEQDTTAGTGWRGRTQLTGSKFSHIEIPLMFGNANYRIEVTEVEEEEVATETTNGDNIAAYTKPKLPQIHEDFLDTISRPVQECDFHDQIREEMFQNESTQPDAPRDFLRSSRSNSFHKQQHYDNRSPSLHNGNRGQGLQYHNHGQNGTGRGYRGYAIRIQAIGVGVSGCGGITDPEVMAENIHLSVAPLLVDLLCSSITALSLSLWRVATKRMGLKINTVRKNGKVATGMAAGEQQQRGRLLTSIITVNNVMLDVNDTSQGVVTAY